MFGLSLVKVQGRSMEPLLPDGSFALFRRPARLRPGDLVLADHPRFGRIVKMVAGLTIDGEVALKGTSPHSTSESRLGSVPVQCVRGKLLASLP